MKNLSVLSFKIPGWLSFDADQGFGFTKLSGYRRIWIRTAIQLLLLLFSFSYNFVYFEKSHGAFPLYSRLATWGTRSGRPACPGRDDHATSRYPITRTSANWSPPRGTHTTFSRQARVQRKKILILCTRGAYYVNLTVSSSFLISFVMGESGPSRVIKSLIHLLLHPPQYGALDLSMIHPVKVTRGLVCIKQPLHL